MLQHVILCYTVVYYVMLCFYMLTVEYGVIYCYHRTVGLNQDLCRGPLWRGLISEPDTVGPTTLFSHCLKDPYRGFRVRIGLRV